MTTLRPAVFLDRDGTLNVERSFVIRPAELVLLPGVAALLQLQEAGFACVVVTNQSAVGRGLMTEVELGIVHAELHRQLAEHGVKLDGIYSCTIAPATEDPLALEHPDRKPAPGLLLRAAADLNLDLASSWMIGDGMRDILAGQNAGCHGCIMVRSGKPIDESQFALARPFVVVDDLPAAVRHILAFRTIPR
jgi:D-glycero-D-manno-heptose 1,7-bisphosphate phosphatase